jgi:hypothetical protein
MSNGLASALRISLVCWIQGSQDGGHAEQRSVLLVFTSFIKLWSGSRQQSVELNKTTVALDLKVDRTNAKPSGEDLAGKQDNS